VSPKKKGVPEDELSKMQKQMEFMFGEMMSRFEDRFEKLETKVESGLGKRVKKLGRKRVLLETL
jgi:tetrahydromethanopterin S-methyltransferase subunit G